MTVAPSTHTLYIAGPMRGYPAFNFAAFDRARLSLRRRGFAVICPAELDREAGFDEHVDEFTEKLGYEVARRDLRAILSVDAVAVLRGFTGSAGARVELAAARWLGLPVVAADDPAVDLTAGVDSWLAGDGISLDVDAYERNRSAAVTIERPAEAQRGYDLRVSQALRLVGLELAAEAASDECEECEECASLPVEGCECEWCDEVSADMAALDDPPPSPRRVMLDEAANLVDGDRNVSYGDPSADFRRTASLWSTYLDGKTELDPHDVAALMALLKLSRIRWSPEKRDSWVDLAGYAACGLSTVPEAWQT